VAEPGIPLGFRQHARSDAAIPAGQFYDRYFALMQRLLSDMRNTDSD